MAKLKSEACRLKAILLSDSSTDRSVLLSDDEDRAPV
jgi:hypothetical protein